MFYPSFEMSKIELIEYAAYCRDFLCSQGIELEEAERVVLSTLAGPPDEETTPPNDSKAWSLYRKTMDTIIENDERLSEYHKVCFIYEMNNFYPPNGNSWLLRMRFNLD